jgi:Zn-dependent peptidase ImmA (M78 family)/transcriptional regulator with XRE-family HTH domain
LVENDKFEGRESRAIRDQPSIDPRVLGARLQGARRARNLTQEAVADSLGLARTTLVAIEKGERRVTAHDIRQLAELYGRKVADFVGHYVAAEDLVPQFRTTLRDGDASGPLQSVTEQLQRLAERYVELESMWEAPLARNYPPVNELSGTPPELAGEELATAERNRLGLGDGPVGNLRDRLESDVGLRIFYIEMPAKTAGLFAYNETLGGCIAINAHHPAGRQRWTLAHEFAHFLTSRFSPEVTLLVDKKRSPREQLADSFAKNFLMPATGLNRRFSELHRSRQGQVTLADVCTLATLYAVSVQALIRRLENLKRVSVGLWDRLAVEGFRPQKAQHLLGQEDTPLREPRLPLRYELLAYQAYRDGRLSEGQFATYLEVDRVSARDRSAILESQIGAEREGEFETLSLPLSRTLTGV